MPKATMAIMSEARQARVAEMWRFPVKSMRGERVDQADIGEAGFAGDRAYAVLDAETGKIASAKHPRLWGTLLQCARALRERADRGRARRRRS